MVNRIQLCRVPGLPTMAALQADVELYQASQVLLEFLENKDPNLLSHQDFADYLSTQYSHVALTIDPMNYKYVWDPVTEQWIRICHSAAVIEMRNQSGDPPIVLQLADTAQYV